MTAPVHGGRESGVGAASRRSPSASTRAALWQAHGRRCAYTGDPVAYTDLEIDHVIPLAIPPEQFATLVRDQVVAPDFDLNGLGNLLPTSKHQNSRKRAAVRSRTALLHFLEVADQYRPRVESYVRAGTGDGRLLTAFLELKAQADRNDLSVEDVIDIQRQQADGKTRLRHSPELADVGETSLLNAELARAMMKKPFALGGGLIGEVTLQDDEGAQTICSDCASFLAAKDRGLWPRSQYDINCFAMADRNCEMLRALERARFAPVSSIRYPRVTCRDLDRWSSEWVRRVWVDFDEVEHGPIFERCATIADLIATGECELVEATEWRFDVVPARGFALSVSELLRADLDGDDVEEILVFDLAYARGGTFRAGTVVVARSGLDGIIRPVDHEWTGAG